MKPLKSNISVVFIFEKRQCWKGGMKMIRMELGKNSYKDIITGDIYNTSEVLEVKGTLNKILSFEEIMEIENNTYFDDADWTKVYENIRGVLLG